MKKKQRNRRKNFLQYYFDKNVQSALYHHSLASSFKEVLGLKSPLGGGGGGIISKAYNISKIPKAKSPGKSL
jgi:hypothetical protein